MAGEEGTMMLSSIDSQSLKVGITKRKAEETVVAGEKGCTTKRKAEETAVAGEKGYTTKRKAAAGSGDGGLILKEEKLQVEVKPSTGSEVLRTLSSDSDISQPDEPDESKTPSPNSSVSEESGAKTPSPNNSLSEESDAKTPSPNSSVSEESDADGCVSDEYFSEQWENMMAELGFADSDFADYGELAAMNNHWVEEAA